MDLCTAGELFYHLQMRTKFSEPETRFYIEQVVEAIDYLHDKDILYRDLKPENCLIDLKGNLKLVDFGLSKQVKDKTYSFCGSPEYLSPEMLQVENGHDLKSDIYQIGVLTYEMLCGLPPFYDAVDTKKMFESIQNSPVILPTWIST